MVTDKTDPSLAVEASPRAEDPTPAEQRRTSLDEVVKRRRYVRTIHGHPSQMPVPIDQRIVKTAVARNIVVIDDEADQVELTVMVLEAAGHTAHGATRSSAALDLVMEHFADLLVVDFMMPNMTGGAVGRALRADPWVGRTKILILSGTPEDVVRSDFDQFEAFLQKPVHADRLLRTIEDL